MSIQVQNSPISLRYTPFGRSKVELCLCAGQVARIEDIRPGESILCTKGVLWLTRQGDPQDYLLQAGEKFFVDSSGSLIVEALKDSACWSYQD